LQGITSRKSETGEELMVPYDDLSDAAKALDSASVQATLDAALPILERYYEGRDGAYESGWQAGFDAGQDRW
jgi:hypothetical protein